MMSTRVYAAALALQVKLHACWVGAGRDRRKARRLASRASFRCCCCRCRRRCHQLKVTCPTHPPRPIQLQVLLAVIIPIVTSSRLESSGTCLLNESGSTCL